MPFLLLMLIIIVHEMGHFLCAICLKEEVDKICIYPFGGVSKVHQKINIPLGKDFLILIMGPITQLLFMLVFKKFLPIQYQEMFVFYNYNILFFNLLPIYPLDGGKILNIMISYHVSYRKSLSFSLLFSLLGIFFFLFFSVQDIKLNLLLITALLIYNLYREYQKKSFYQEKFLLERYLEKAHFFKRCQVKRVEDFRRDYIHVVKGKGHYETEKEALEKKYSKKF